MITLSYPVSVSADIFLPHAASPAETEKAERKLKEAQAEKDRIAARILAQRETEQDINARSKANQEAKVRACAQVSGRMVAHHAGVHYRQPSISVNARIKQSEAGKRNTTMSLVSCISL